MRRFHFAVFALALFAAACASPSAPAPPAPPAAPADSTPPAPAPPPAWTTTAVDASNSAAVPETMVEMRVATHEGFDRMVFAFSGDDVPGYRIAYVDAPVRACGSGEEVTLPGGRFLEIQFYPTAAHDTAGQPTIARREQTLNLPVVRALRLTCDFEAEVVWAVGLATQRPFRAFALRDPARVVVDVQH